MHHNDGSALIRFDSDDVVQVLDDWQNRSPGAGIFALVAEKDRDSIPSLQVACRQRNIPLIGAMFPALVTDTGFVHTGAWLLRFDHMPPTFLLTNLESDNESAADKITSTIGKLMPSLPKTDAPPVLFMLFDGMLPNISSLLDLIYLRLSNEVSYAGANAGSETFQPMPCLFDSDHLAGSGMLGILLPSSYRFVVDHGFTTPDHVMVASASAGNRVTSIDWRPAFDVYQEIATREYGVALSHQNFYDVAVHFPFGLLRANDEVAVRIPVAKQDDGSISCIGEIPENAMLVLLKAPQGSQDKMIEGIVDALEIDAPGRTRHHPLVTFYCAGRRLHLADVAESELAELCRKSGTSMLVGALSLGEIGSRDGGYPVFHNAALVCGAWSES